MEILNAPMVEISPYKLQKLWQIQGKHNVKILMQFYHHNDRLKCKTFHSRWMFQFPCNMRKVMRQMNLRYPILVLVLFIFQDANQCYSSVLRTHLGTRHNMLLKKISIYKVASFLKGLRHDFRSKFYFLFFMYEMVYLRILND